jgi:hypothetical protein
VANPSTLPAAIAPSVGFIPRRAYTSEDVSPSAPSSVRVLPAPTVLLYERRTTGKQNVVRWKIRGSAMEAAAGLERIHARANMG